MMNIKPEVRSAVEWAILFFAINWIVDDIAENVDYKRIISTSFGAAVAGLLMYGIERGRARETLAREALDRTREP